MIHRLILFRVLARLTRLLLKLDNVQVEGRDDVRKARRQAIASITRCINLLESKLLDSIDRSSQEPESCSAQCEEPHQRAEASADVATAPGSEANAKKESEGGVEQQRVDEKEAPVAPPPVTHVTQLMINIGGPPASEAPNAEAIQEVN